MARVVVSSARGYPTWIMGCCLGKAVFRASTLSVLHSSYSSVVKLEYSVLSPLTKSNLSPFRMAGLLKNQVTFGDQSKCSISTVALEVGRALSI